jgi:hypothetical protein
MKTIRFIPTVLLLFLLGSCSATKGQVSSTLLDGAQDTVSANSVATATAEVKTIPPRHLVSTDFDLASIRAKIDLTETIDSGDCAELIDYYRVLDTLQQKNLENLKKEQQNILQKREWVDWFTEDTSVFSKHWDDYELPPFLKNNVCLYTLLGTIKQYMDAIENDVKKVKEENPKLAEEYMRPVIKARIDEKMNKADGLFNEVEKLTPKKMLSQKQYDYYRTQVERFNSHLKYYD